MTAGHSYSEPKVTVPVVRKSYDGGAVSFHIDHDGRKVRVAYGADGKVRMYVDDKLVGTSTKEDA
jgi:hypothetical protein